MKTIGISVEDDLYAVAVSEAAKHRQSVSDWLHDLLVSWLRHQTSADKNIASPPEKQREEFLRFLDELNAKPRQPGPSVGPLNREELYAERLDRFR